MDIPPQDLPLWMRRARQRVDWGALLVLLFGLLAASTPLFQNDLARTYNGEHYVYQTAAYAAAIAEGRLYPRWLPDALGGYGAPVPHYYPPGVAYVAAWVQFFITADPVNALRLVLIVLTGLAGMAVYTLATRHVGEGGGMLAALLFLFSPYFGMTAPHILGDLPAFAGLALLAALLWSVDGVLRRNRPLDGLALSGAVALLLLTHVEMAVAGMGLAVVYAGAYRARRRVNLLSILVRLVAGAGAAACFWLPAAAEQDAVIWRTQDALALLPVSVENLFFSTLPIDPGALLPPPDFSLGAAAWIGALATAGALLVRRKTPGARFATFFLLVGAVLAAGALLLPFHWLIGTATLCFALSGGWLAQALTARALPLLCVGVLAASAPLWVSPPASARISDTSATAQIAYEQIGFGTAALPSALPLPTTLTDVSFNRALINGYESGTINKLISDTIGGGVRIGVIAHQSHLDSFQITTSQATTFTLLTAYFPGWTAHLNDVPIPITRDPGTGLIRLSLNNATVGTLTFSLDTTPIRTAAWTITWGAVLFSALLTARRARRYRPDQDEEFDYPRLTPPQVRLLGLGLVLFGIGVLLVLVSPTTRPPAGYWLETSRPLRARTLDGLEVVGFALMDAPLTRTNTVNFHVYWRAVRPITPLYRARIGLINVDTGEQHPITEPRHPGGIPTRRWLSGLYVVDSYHLPIPARLEAGRYSPFIQVFACTPVCADQPSAFVAVADGAPLGGNIILPLYLVRPLS